MALSSSGRKNAYERSIVRQREREFSSRQKWEDNAKYFHDSGIQVNKFDSWAKKPVNPNLDGFETFKRHHEMEMRQMQLQRRRSELAKLLKDENMEYEAQLRGMSKDDIKKLVSMREQVEGLRSAREVERQAFADEKLFEHWRINNSAIRKVESDNLRQYVAESWGDQINEKQSQKVYEQADEAEWNRRMEMIARDDAARETAELSAKQQQEMEYREELRLQAEEMAKREAESEISALEEHALMNEIAVLEKVQTDRREAEIKRQKEEHGKLLKRQHTARLLRISRQVQAELEADRMFLAELAAREAKDDGFMTQRKETERANASWMKKTIEDQMRLEKQREAELEQLYADEAEREWQKRESEWNRERQARERLMQEVLNERKMQLQEKYTKLKEMRFEVADDRADADYNAKLAEIDSAREKARNDQIKDAQRTALERQIMQQNEAAASAAMANQLEAVEDAKLAEEMDDLVRIETARLRKKGNQTDQTFAPMVQGKRVTWR